MNKEQGKQYLIDYYNENGKLPRLKDIAIKNGFPFSYGTFIKWFGSKTEFEEMIGIEKKTYYTIVKCLQCGVEFSKAKRYIKEHSNNFCTRSCSATYNNSNKNMTQETKDKISERLRNIHRELGTIVENRICHFCKKSYKPHKRKKKCKYNFCSRKCKYDAYYNDDEYKSFIKPILQDNGKKLAVYSKKTKRYRRSKNEIYMFELCKNHFGEEVLANPKIFNGWDADIVIPSFKIAIRWNGIWHYRKVRENHDLEDVKRRDRIKEQAIEDCGYEAYIIKDMGKHKKKFVEEQFALLLEYIEKKKIIGREFEPH